jgi:hypothetical protein
MEELKLNNFSCQVAAQLFEHFPQWRSYAQAEDTEFESGILYLEIPLPSNSNLERSLYVLTDREQVEVGFDFNHNHFESVLGDDDSVDMKSVIDFIYDIFSDKIVAVSWWAKEKCRGGTLACSDRLPEPSEHIHPFDRVRIRSWNGTFDQDIRF